MSPTAQGTTSSTSDLDNNLPITNNSITLQAGTPPGNPIQEILDAFNDKKPLQLVNAVKSVASTGVTITGTADFAGTAQAIVTAFFKSPTDVSLNMQLSGVNLTRLLPSSALKLPSSFSFNLPTAWALIKRGSDGFSLTAATKFLDGSEMAITANHATGGWNVVAGLDMKLAGLANVPIFKGSPLVKFDSFVGLSDILVVISSADGADFDFPDVDQLSPQAQGLGKITLPSQATKLVEGVNVYARLNTATGKGFQALAKYLHLKLDGSIGVTLDVSLPEPENNSRFFIDIQEEITKGLTLDGAVGIIMTGGELGAFLNGTAVAKIQGQPVTFTVQALVVETGVVISGSMQNTAPIHFDIDKVRFALANIGLVIGIDDEGIPSFGFAGEIEIGKFDASLALFVDSVTPQNSMFAAAVSDLTLLDIAECIAQQKDIPPDFRLVLGAIGLKPLKAFTLPLTSIVDLNNRNLTAISAAFAAHGVVIPQTSDKILLDINTRGSLWYLTDLNTITHYVIKVSGSSIAVSYEPQLYCAPQDTNIGGLTFNKGFHVEGVLDLAMINAQVKVEIKGLTGVSADVTVSPIHLVNNSFFSVTGFNGAAGPQVSIGTFTNPEQPNPKLQPPHVYISGEVTFLGAPISATYFCLNTKGLSFEIERQLIPLLPFLQIDIKGNIGDPTNMSLGGGLVIGINNTLDLGALGHVAIKADINGAITAGVTNGVAFARIQGGMQFAKWSLTLPTIELDVSGKALANIVETVIPHLVELIVKDILSDATEFISLAKSGLITVGKDAAHIAGVLKSEFKKGASEVSSLLHSAGYAVNDIAGVLRNVFSLSAKDATSVLKDGLKLGSDAINSALKGVGYAAKDVEDALSDAFDWAKSHANPSKW